MDLLQVVRRQLRMYTMRDGVPYKNATVVRQEGAMVIKCLSQN